MVNIKKLRSWRFEMWDAGCPQTLRHARNQHELVRQLIPMRFVGELIDEVLEILDELAEGETVQIRIPEQTFYLGMPRVFYDGRRFWAMPFNRSN